MGRKWDGIPSMAENKQLLSHKTVGSRTVAKGKMRIRGGQGSTAVEHGHATTTMGHDKHYRQPVVVVVPGALCFVSLLRYLLFLARDICYGVSVLGHFWPS